MEEVIARSVAPRHFRMLLFGLFALLALVLAVIGVYGVMAYSSSQRAREFGVRIALGANRRDILKLVIGQGFEMALVGVGVGIAGALVLTRFLSSLLYGVSPHDPMTFVGVAVLLLTVALAALLDSGEEGDARGSDGGAAIRINLFPRYSEGQNRVGARLAARD